MRVSESLKNVEFSSFCRLFEQPRMNLIPQSSPWMIKLQWHGGGCFSFFCANQNGINQQQQQQQKPRLLLKSKESSQFFASETVIC